MNYATPQAAEDAYYDALESADLDALVDVWDLDDNTACLLPMRPLAVGKAAIAAAFKEIFDAMPGVDLQVSHIAWIESGDIAVHLVEETPSGGPPGQPAMSVYATNIYRLTGDGWRMILHQNAPVPPPGFRPEAFPHLP